MVACECYTAMLEMDDRLQTLCIEEQRNQDVFAWSQEDMPRIDPSIIVHKLNVSPSFPPIR